MNCTNCGNPVSEGTKFCGKCGQKIEHQTVSQVVEKKTPRSTGEIIKKIFQVIAVILFVASLGTISSEYSSDIEWLEILHNLLTICIAVTFFGLLGSWWRNRKTEKKWFGWRVIIFLIILTGLSFATVVFSQAINVAREKAMKNPDLKSEYINNVVEAAKAQMSFPKQIDESTMMTGISAGENSVRYSYLLSGLDTSNLSNESLKDSLRSSICQSESTKNLFDKGIDLEFSYFVKESRQGYLVRFTPSDCL